MPTKGARTVGGTSSGRAEARSGARPFTSSVLAMLVEQAQRAIERADAKASMLTATATAVLAVAAQGLLARSQGPLLICAETLWLAGIAVLAGVVFPRIRQRRPGSALASFADFPRRLDLERLRDTVETVESDPETLLLVQVHALSRIALTKYRLLRCGIILLGSGMVLGIAGLVAR